MIKDILKILEGDARITIKQISTMTGTPSADRRGFWGLRYTAHLSRTTARLQGGD